MADQSTPDVDVDVLIVGAGPTGLALAAELAAFGIRIRVIDRQPDRVHESRALAIQPRTLEMLAPLGIADTLVEAGNRMVRLQIHFPRRSVVLPLASARVRDTRYPYLLFLSQAETERILGEHLTKQGVPIERGVELVGLEQGTSAVTAALRTERGTARVRARYVVGCDGAHSAVRHLSGIPFAGRVFPQTFALADLEVDELATGGAHAYLGEAGPLFFFPLGWPTTWRMLIMVEPGARPDLAVLQRLISGYTDRPLTLRDPVWSTTFTVHSRYARRFRDGRAFLAGDAAHIHSPAGAQGMNTGIQDAVNLGWKLALACTGRADDRLLDSYEKERLPIARMVLRMTNRAFRVATAPSLVARFARLRVVPLLVPLVLRSAALRTAGFRIVAQLRIRYRRSPLSQEARPRMRRGSRAGDRLPDLPVRQGGTRTSLHRLIAHPGFHLLLLGEADWELSRIERRWPGLIRSVRLTDRLAMAELGVHDLGAAHYLVRPDGHVSYRARGLDLDGLDRHLGRVFG
jgi:2-polyprenyl-6-methoxyphenol hydroxylase-like FAD-dependent oxidoreductase